MAKLLVPGVVQMVECSSAVDVVGAVEVGTGAAAVVQGGLLLGLVPVERSVVANMFVQCMMELVDCSSTTVVVDLGGLPLGPGPHEGLVVLLLLPCSEIFAESVLTLKTFGCVSLRYINTGARMRGVIVTINSSFYHCKSRSL